MAKAKRGDLVEVAWLDAHFSTDPDEAFVSSASQGGERVYSVGFLCMIFPKSIVLVTELDKAKGPSRDFTCIPRAMVEEIRIIRKNKFPSE